MANQLFNNGRYQEASENFEQIASFMEAEHRPNAYHFYLFAARARSMAGDDDASVALMEKGLGLLIRDNRRSELERVGARLIQELIDRNRNAEADKIKEFLAQNSIDIHSANQEAPIPEGVNVPTHCPSCGAVIYGVGIEWLNKKTIMCSYCGTPIKID
ncbi:MAG: hypothetical protein HPY76_08725 [Anaerolineae bacterium]|nr:hypothetical protein [Anaerolineae bacterium]